LGFGIPGLFHHVPHLICGFGANSIQHHEGVVGLGFRLTIAREFNEARTLHFNFLKPL